MQQWIYRPTHSLSDGLVYQHMIMPVVVVMVGMVWLVALLFTSCLILKSDCHVVDFFPPFDCDCIYVFEPSFCHAFLWGNLGLESDQRQKPHWTAANFYTCLVESELGYAGLKYFFTGLCHQVIKWCQRIAFI